VKKITDRKKLILYGCSGLGVNMLNMIMGSYLVSALQVGGFASEDIGLWTYLDKDLIIPFVWIFIGFFAKALDGIIDLPFATFADKLKTSFGRRKTGILMGYIPMMISFILFLVTPFKPGSIGADIASTIWFGVLLCSFYTFYTLTMLTYYATFSEICANEKDMTFLSNTKSICDVVYMSLVYALFPVFVNVMGLNVRNVAIIFFPLVLTMLIPMFTLKENNEEQGEIRVLTLKSALSTSFQNKAFIYWMSTCFVTTIGLQLFLGGINELFSNTDLNMTIVMASSFAPVPFTIMLYNRFVKNKGLGFAYRYVLTVFACGMLIMLSCLGISNLDVLLPSISDSLPAFVNSALEAIMKNSGTILLVISLVGGVAVSFSLGAFFSVTYMVPSRLAQIEYEKSGKGVASMLFAVHGLFEGIAAGIATGVILTSLKWANQIWLLPIIAIVCCAIAFAMSFKFSDDVALMGKQEQ
jgi:Na+/melibiose symporter-like transporter